MATLVMVTKETERVSSCGRTANMTLYGGLLHLRSLRNVKLARAFSDYIVRNLVVEGLKDDYIPHEPYGGRHVVTMLPGDGIGPELMEHVEDIITFTNAPIDFEKIRVKDETLEEDLQSALLSVRRNGCGIKGTVEPNLANPNFVNPNVMIRNSLDLFINMTYCRSFPGLKTRHRNVDCVLIRQNTEGEYAMHEHESKKGVVESLKIITTSNTERVAEWAFNFARKNSRKKITVVHKANIMKVADGLFLKTVKRVSEQYPEIECDDLIIDNCSMQLVINPQRFDILVMPNLYGTILNNVACGLTGGPGVRAGANFGYNYAIFEPACRNLGKSLVGSNKANPLAMLKAVVGLLFYLGCDDHANIIKRAIQMTVQEDKVLTPDIGGKNTTEEVVDTIKENILKC